MPTKAKPVVHYCMYGQMACQKPGPPGSWKDNDTWDSDWKNVTCPECLMGKQELETFTISEDGKAITCKRCKKVSHHPKDVENLYCANCHAFHDDIWPPSRYWWITHPDHDDWITQVRVLITNANPKITVRRIMEIFVATSEYMESLSQSYWKRLSPEEAYEGLQVQFGKDFIKG